MPVPSEILHRDKKNALRAQELAQQQRLDSSPMMSSVGVIDRSSARYSDMRRKSLDAILHDPFHVMVEVEIELRNGKEESFIWYGNERVEVNCPLSGSGAPIVLAWTHPGLQAALVTDLEDQEDLYSSGLNMVAVLPKRRARFYKTVPDIQGMYEPGGSIGLAATSKPDKKSGLKAVKLNMTRDQVRAFASHMQGILLITGAPGSGKTTIAYQRVRFLLDQQNEVSSLPITYDQGNVQILLANKNLLHYSQNLLESELGLRRNLVSLVPEFVTAYVDAIWRHKWGAHLIQRQFSRLEERGRDAVFGLTDDQDLKNIWAIYERQVRDRLKVRKNMPWALLTKPSAPDGTANLQSSFVDFADQIVANEHEPKRSPIRIDRLYSSVQKQYNALRKDLNGKTLDKFDSEFAKWLYYVYDPIETMYSFLTKYGYKTSTRVDRGIAGRGNADRLFKDVVNDFKARRFSLADQSMAAFLLRFALPEQSDEAKRFKGISTPWNDGERWTHLVIDEAQDLSAPEAALLASLVDVRGALTISADFRQRVSATHGIENAEPIMLGCQIGLDGLRRPFRFAVNKRQTPPIAKFLMGYYEANFGEAPPFDVDKDYLQDPPPPVPELFIGNHQNITQRLKQLKNLPSLAKGSVAILQINENPEEKRKIQGYLRSIGVESVPPVHNAESPGSKWILATVEEIKGLEFDACLVFGMDGVDAAELDFTRNRAYVALSRPAYRLVMFCHDFPILLRGVPSDRYSKKDATR